MFRLHSSTSRSRHIGCRLGFAPLCVKMRVSELLQDLQKTAKVEQKAIFEGWNTCEALRKLAPKQIL